MPDLVGKIWADGSFGFAHARRAPLSTLSPEPPSPSPQESELADLGHSLLAAGHSLEESFAIANQERERLGLSMPFKSTKTPLPPAPRGSGGITSHGRKVLRSSVTLLEQRYGRRRLVFQTLTLPSVTKEEADHLTRNWSSIVHTYTKRLRRALESKGLPTDFAGCVELQERRLAVSGVRAYHLHLVFVGRHGSSSNSPWAIPLADHDLRWKGVVEHYLGRSVDASKSVNTQQVRKSAVAYLAKYLSKKGSKRAPSSEGGSPQTGVAPSPKAWYFVSRALKHLVLSTRITCPQVILVLSTLLFSGSLEVFYQSCVNYSLPDGSVFPIGFYGRLTPSSLEQVQAYYYSL